ncbi:hypothetical protein [Vibrio harveyi]|uniref:hypothetical protein n=1 Tax=Vibrio harveyi TaxID=669 RepID=UPI0003753AFE|nr:hypothetical protein [Vibrio harveyi]
MKIRNYIIILISILSHHSIAQDTLFGYKLGEVLNISEEKNKDLTQTLEMYNNGEKYFTFKSPEYKVNKNENFTYSYKIWAKFNDIKIYNVSYKIKFPSHNSLDVFNWLHENFGEPTSGPIQVMRLVIQPGRSPSELATIDISPSKNYSLSWGCKLVTAYSPLLISNSIFREDNAPSCIKASSMYFEDNGYVLTLDLR